MASVEGTWFSATFRNWLQIFGGVTVSFKPLETCGGVVTGIEISTLGLRIVGSDGLQLSGDATQWDDLPEPLIGKNIDTTSGRIDYNYDENTVDFANNARYPEEPICLTSQMRHKWLVASTIHPHLHWMQNQDADPNWLLKRRTIKNGEAPTAWVLAVPSTLRKYTYSSGNILQITEFPAIDMTGLAISDHVDFQLFRDTGNVSTLFGGADGYTGDAAAKDFDSHYEKDSLGSREEYVK